MKTILDYALAYSHKSYSVIPIVGKDKKPAIQSWESNQSLFWRNYISAKGIFSKYVLRHKIGSSKSRGMSEDENL